MHDPTNHHYARDVQQLDDCEVCAPDDPGFPPCQLAALRRAVARYPAHYIWIGTADRPSDFVVDHARNRMESQTQIFALSRDFRVWLVQYGKTTQPEPLGEGMDDLKPFRRKNKFNEGFGAPR